MNRRDVLRLRLLPSLGEVLGDFPRPGSLLKIVERAFSLSVIRTGWLVGRDIGFPVERYYYANSDLDLCLLVRVRSWYRSLYRPRSGLEILRPISLRVFVTKASAGNRIL